MEIEIVLTKPKLGQRKGNTIFLYPYVSNGSPDPIIAKLKSNRKYLMYYEGVEFYGNSITECFQNLSNYFPNTPKDIKLPSEKEFITTISFKYK